MVPISEKMAPFAEEGTIRRMEGLSSEDGVYPQKMESIPRRWSLSPEDGVYPQKRDSILVGLSPILSLWGVVTMRWQSYENLRINCSIFTIFFASKTSAWVEVTPYLYTCTWLSRRSPGQALTGLQPTLACLSTTNEYAIIHAATLKRGLHTSFQYRVLVVETTS